MSSLLERLPERSRVAIIRLRSLGDCVLATPAIHLLKSYRPDLKLSVVAEPRFVPVFEENPDIDDIIMPSAPLLRRWRPNLSINLHGGTRSLFLTTASLARYRAGFAHYRYALAYNIRIPRAQEILGEERVVHTAEHAAAAMFHLGVPKQAVPRARLFSAKRWRDSGYAVIHPYASAPEKTWSPQRFLDVAEFMRRALHLEPIFIGGPGDDPAPFRPWPVEISTDLRKTKSLLASASLFFGNDSGPAHMAAAFGLPVAVLYGPSNPDIWAPWRTESQVLHSSAGMDGITSAQAVEAVSRLKVIA
ncbi:glycosyltransferase family 9 protein [Bryobacter aggregatus]|uniref:glycosyltransferase family 9 protein n=1 Tax=Bryobacter aggregatus TaxID=360054 RepID=UPI0004E109B4|nr:glycosyltransferase family 9 protein [Bryobacter aggregatus]